MFLVSLKVSSYADLLDMPYDKFIALEKVFSITQELKSGKINNTKKSISEETKSKIAGLQSVKFDDLDLPDHYKEIFEH